ncbi:hypothetical protein RCOM_0898170 [Ricinus communis]|uniref:Epidermal patterning factor-like protein n=1 Tax=Ricinus communis TaxID=3988 RepID=B9RV22_RICCO|nr:hypothetical protein RCOM_0898170 [Ricinus communis]
MASTMGKVVVILIILCLLLLQSFKPADALKFTRIGYRSMNGRVPVPPRCMNKCTVCSPCKPVLVTRPPKLYPKEEEYYPLAWKCSCGGHLYDP